MTFFPPTISLSQFRPWRGTLVLAYHRIAPPYERPAGEVWSASADRFEAQLRYLARNADVVLPSDLGTRSQRGGRRVMITFDDGYRDNFDVALPLLRQYGLKALFFIATGLIDGVTSAWWEEITWMVEHHDERSVVTAPAWIGAPNEFRTVDGRKAVVRRILERYKQTPTLKASDLLDDVAQAIGSKRWDGAADRNAWMTWDMIRALQRNGMVIGGHTVTHPVLSRTPLEEQRREISECRERIAHELGTPMELFAYPVGRRDTFDKRTVATLKEEGVRYAFSLYGGYNPPQFECLDLRRTSIWPGMKMSRFRALNLIPQAFARD